MQRREFLYGINGGLGALAFHSMLRAETAEGPLTPKVAHFPKTKAKRCIFLYMAGGPSHIDTFDPKPGAETQGDTKAIRTNVDDIIISENFPKLAYVMDKIALIRSMNSTTGAHGQGQYLFHTSYKPRNTIKHPFLGAWVTKMLPMHLEMDA